MNSQTLAVYMEMAINRSLRILDLSFGGDLMDIDLVQCALMS